MTRRFVLTCELPTGLLLHQLGYSIEIQPVKRPPAWSLVALNLDTAVPWLLALGETEADLRKQVFEVGFDVEAAFGADRVMRRMERWGKARQV